jgi:selenocysteine lyase/cysteine desulfurase
MSLNRRQLLTAVSAGFATAAAGCRDKQTPDSAAKPDRAKSTLRESNGSVDWRAVRDLFPLTKAWTHFASFLLVSHPKPVADAIENFRQKIDNDPLWIEAAAFSDSEGRPYAAVKRALAEYVGGLPEEICLTSNTTTALAMAYHGLRIRQNQEIVTTDHDHYSHHESIRFAAARSGCGVRYINLYDRPAVANATEIVDRVAKSITPKTRAVGVTWVHSSTGVKIPVQAIADTVKRANSGRIPSDRCLLIVDGVHGFANQDVDVAKLGCDFFASGTHKWLFAPRGTGFLWGAKEVWPELRPTIPTFDPDAPQPWAAWMDRANLPPTQASFISPGGFMAYEYILAIPAAVDLQRTIGRNQIAKRIQELNAAFRESARTIPGLTLHTPLDPELSGAISCFEIKGIAPEEIDKKLAAKKIRTNASPYKVSYARVAAGIMNSPEEVDTVLEEIRVIAG